MTREEHKALIQNIMNNAGNQGELSLLLTQLSDDYDHVLTESETAAANVATLTADNETLRKANLQLFLKTPQEKTHDTPADKGGNNDSEKLTFEALFDENGGLK